MPSLSTQAIVIHSLPYGEADKIVTFFTEDYGKIKGMAKGARKSRKRFQNALDLFTFVRLTFFEREGRGLVRVEGCEILDSHPGIREDFKKISYGNYVLELIGEMAGEREVNREVFQLLVRSLSELERTEPGEDWLRTFEIRVLALFGYRPNMRRCGGCKRVLEELKDTGLLFFSIEKGGIVCESCGRTSQNLISLSPGTARLIDKVSLADFFKIQRLKFTPKALAESRGILPKFISYVLGKEPRSWKVLKALDEGKAWVRETVGLKVEQ